ncbi:DUF805 domain-containing protein [Kiloniella majae]|uniref:DUF805 domain-containing protein n=1 Tax=Kiloniella majae TaxID=1938558 RepID=UPI001C3FCCA3|nr:DUF805 domain-containing protein [Kiloniella majae]
MTDSTMTQPPVASGSQDFSWKWFLLSSKGRISRSDYWLKYFLPYFVINIVLSVLDFVLGTISLETGLGLFSGVFALLAIIPSILILIKRWHDRDKSGWWTLIIFVPIIGAFWVLIECGFLRGTAGPNRFGPSRFPEEQNINEVFE